MRSGLALVLALAAAACAQPRQPAGGPPVEHPPRVIEVSPEPFETVTNPRQPVIIRFDERLSERLEGVRDWNDAVIVSPQTSEVRVRRGRRHIQVSLAGGWRPGLVYRVEVLPVIRDLFNNVRDESIELVFSTGPEIQETAVAGYVEDRLTGRPVRGARIAATDPGVGLTYVSVTDSAGLFAIRHLPPGSYEVQGWLDQNRNLEVDFSEPQDTAEFLLAPTDTVVVEMQLLPRDTTEARLLRAVVLDSLRLELTFDDYFEPGPVDGRALIYRQADSALVAEGALFHATRLDSLRQAEREAGAVEEADVEPEVEAEEVADPEAARRLPPGLPRAEPDRRPEPEERQELPSRSLIVLLEEPLEPETGHYVVVTGVVNIHGIPDGGGQVAFRTPEPPPEPEPAPEPDAEPDPPPDDDGPPPDPDAPPPDDDVPPADPDPAPTG